MTTLKKPKERQPPPEMENETVICNKCGKSCRTEFMNDHKGNEYTEINYEGGWGSLISDLSSIQLHLCDVCIVEILDSCVIPPSVHVYHSGDYVWDKNVEPRKNELINYLNHFRKLTMDDIHAEALAINAALDKEKLWVEFMTRRYNQLYSKKKEEG